MQRYHLFELEDLVWWPRAWRDGCTEFLQFIVSYGKPYQAFVPRLAVAIEKCQATVIVDLCSGAGGPWRELLPALHAEGCAVGVLLTDKFPNLAVSERLRATVKDVKPVPYSVDATDVPGELKVFRTLFAGFHHLRPEAAQQVLASAVRDRQGIAVFEFTNRSSWSLVMTLLTPVRLWLLSPFIWPFHWTRLFWIYLVPVLPFAIMFDGLVSCLRTYTAEEMRAMVAKLDSEDYEWEIGVEYARESNFPITYLIGVARVHPLMPRNP